MTVSLESTPRVVFTRRGLIAGFRACLPVAVSVALFGLAFGAIARQAGLSLFEAGLMSALVNAGASQMATVDLWPTAPSLALIALVVGAVNARHLLMGATLRTWFAPLGAVERYGSLFMMSDANWALAIDHRRRGGEDAAFLLGGGLAMYPSWVAGTVAGHALGAMIIDPAALGADFVVLAFFIALLAPAWRGRRDLWPWAVAGGVSLAVHHVAPGHWDLPLGALAGSLAGMVVRDDA